MDTEKYRILLTVVEKGSFTAASEVLGYTPSGVSRSISALESELGLKLLYRGKKGTMPTAACRSILPAAMELIKAEDNLTQTAETVKGVISGHIVIGTAYSCYYKWIADITSRFHDMHPGVDFKIIYGTSTELAAKIEKHKADFCIISRRESYDSEWLPVLTDELVAVLPPDHILSASKRIPVSIFATEPYIDTYPGQDIDNARVFKKCNIKPNTQVATMDIYATYSMVEAGLGISMNNRINSRLQNSHVLHAPLDPPQTVEIGIACALDPAPAAQAFMEYMSKRMPEHK